MIRRVKRWVTEAGMKNLDDAGSVTTWTESPD